MLVIGAKKDVKTTVKKIQSMFSGTEVGACSQFLGIKLERRTKGIILSQSTYARRIDEAAGLADCKPYDTLLPLAHSLFHAKAPMSAEERLTMRIVPFCHILGLLIYLTTRTQSDLCTSVSIFDKFKGDPS